ncbi:pyridoxal phosphate-dependent transferase [Pseudoneurospora amorphoporcata]|uniref:Pyridoxal phosphate-dependent transferase n=1 Tax=Pseudoneurospora amorphoporcata TaxID=241081 RepID=A0AAN6SEN3_9PEZI|nr:pyridoxal phosphate-dependent transferase [Pseudoneurospora amorphoporcata]
MTVVKPITTPLGQSLPPHGPHAITTHLPGWNTALRLRDGDPELGKQLKSMYPRFTPLSLVKDLCTKLLTHLSSTVSPDSDSGISPSTHGCLPFSTPDAFPLSAAYCVSHHRPDEHRFSDVDASALQFRVVDFFNVPIIPIPPNNNPSATADADDAALTAAEIKIRLYLVIYPLDKAKGVKGIWTDPGIGISTRLAEVLLPLVDADAVRENPESEQGQSQMKMKVLDWAATGRDFLPTTTGSTTTLTEKDVPPPTYLPESDAHDKLRERIVALCRRDPLDPEIAARLTPKDVFLYTTGMAAVFRLHEALVKAGRRGPVVALGAVFHSTFHLFEELEGGQREGEEKVEAFKHFGNCEDSDKVMGELEEYAKQLKEKGRGIGYLFVEFPSNPLLVSVDLGRLRKIADEYDFPVVIDETVGSFCNIDVLPVADVVVTSLTKTFSGFADVSHLPPFPFFFFFFSPFPFSRLHTFSGTAVWPSPCIFSPFFPSKVGTYANTTSTRYGKKVMAGSILLSPSSRYHSLLLSTLTITHNNTLSPPDASRLLSNSQSYLSRSATHNLNAQMLASLLHTYSTTTHQSEQSPRVISRVLYPTTMSSSPGGGKNYYLHYMRSPPPSGSTPPSSSPSLATPLAELDLDGNESFTPGFGCLLSIDFPSKRIARAFYDNLHVHQGPHLGAHLTLALPFNDLLWGGGDEQTKRYHAGYGAVGEQVRVSVGLEEWEELKAVFEYALGKAGEAAREEAAGEEEAEKGEESKVEGGEVPRAEQVGR